jgi:hypothetical protein
MIEHKAQITPPEQPARLVKAVEISEETTNEDVVKACSDIVATNVGNLLCRKLNIIDERLEALEFIDQDTFVHKIEKLKAALMRLYQQVKFASYDYEYGFEDNDDHLRATVDLPGENSNLLVTFGAITWVLEQADSALIRSHEDLGELKKIIQESQNRLADLAQSNQHKKEKASLKRTIKNREKRLKPKRKRHKNLVRAINNMLNLDHKDMDALLQGADTLLAFMIKNELIDESLARHFTTTPNGMKQRYQIKKIIEEVEEAAVEAIEDPTPALSQEARARRNRRRRRRKQRHKSQQTDPYLAMPEELEWVEEEEEKVKIVNMVEELPGWMQKLTPATNNKELLICALLSLTAFFALWQYINNQQKTIGGKLPHPMHEIARHIIGPEGKKHPYKLLCTSPSIGLDDKDLRLVMYENARRQSERIINMPVHIEAADIEKANKGSKAAPITVIDSNGTPIKFYISIDDFVQGFHGSEFIKMTGRDDPDGPFNQYRVTMVRRAKVVVTFVNTGETPFEIPLESTVKFVAKVRKADDPREKEL